MLSISPRRTLTRQLVPLLLIMSSAGMAVGFNHGLTAESADDVALNETEREAFHINESEWAEEPPEDQGPPQPIEIEPPEWLPELPQNDGPPPERLRQFVNAMLAFTQIVTEHSARFAYANQWWFNPFLARVLTLTTMGVGASLMLLHPIRTIIQEVG